MRELHRGGRPGADGIQRAEPNSGVDIFFGE